MNAEQRATLWARLAGAGLVSGEPPLPQDARSPWFVRLMLGVAGWIGALFLLGFVGAGLAFLIKSSAAAWVAGAGACLAAATLFRANKGGDFTAPFGLGASSNTRRTASCCVRAATDSRWRCCRPSSWTAASGTRGSRGWARRAAATSRWHGSVRRPPAPC